MIELGILANSQPTTALSREMRTDAEEFFGRNFAIMIVN